jgi:hypothetical protein
LVDQRKEQAMTGNSSNDGHKRDFEDAAEADPQSKHGDQGESVNGGRQTGPNSTRGGEPIAPQTGEPIEHSH